MKFSALDTTEEQGRKGRLLVGYVGGGAFVAALLICGVVFGSQIKKQVLEEQLDVKFVKQQEAPPPPPPPPPPQPKKRQAVARVEQAPALGNPVPKEIPKELPPETDPSQAKAAVDHVDGPGDPNGVLGGKGRGTAIAPPPEPAKEPARIPDPSFLPENATAPIPILHALPAYPETARLEGLEAVVVVKFTVNEDGSVTDIVVVRGHDTFNDLVRAAVAMWTFKPATLEGKAIRVRRVARIPFKLRTQ